MDELSGLSFQSVPISITIWSGILLWLILSIIVCAVYMLYKRQRRYMLSLQPHMKSKRKNDDTYQWDVPDETTLADETQYAEPEKHLRR